MASKLKTALMQLFNSELAIDERLKGGVELCELLENTAVDDDLREAVPEIFEKIQNILTETDVQFIKEAPLQRLRHICLEVVQKIRNVDFFRPYAPSLLSLLFKLVEQENEENVLLCVKQIIDLYKVYRPHFSADVSQFLVFVQRVYRNLKGQVFNIFKPQQVYEIDSIIDFNVEIFLPHIFTITKLQTKDIKDDGSYSTYHILPKSCFSLKVMQEIPILVVLMYQLFKQQIHQDVSAFIPLIMEFINMKPLEEHRLDPAFRQDKFIDFLAAQVKTLSFLAYVIKIYQDLVEQHSTALVKGMMNLLVTCPPSVTNMRKEFFIAARHILSAQEIRPKFLPVLDDLMNEDILIGQGYTVRDALRPLAYSTLADLTHHLRADLSLTKMALATDLFGRNMFDDSLPFSIQQMSLRLLLNLVECIRQRVAMTGLQQQQHDTIRSTVTRQINTSSARRLLLQIMRLCVLKCQLVAERFLPELEAKCSKEEIETGNTDLNTNLRSQHQKAGSCTISHTDVNAASEAPEIEQEAQVYGSHAPFLTSEVLNQGQLTFTDLRALTKSLATGMRTVVTSLTQCPHWNSSGEDAEDLADTPPSPKLLQTTELNILSDYLTFGLRMIDVLRIVSKDGQLYLRGPHSGAKYPDERFLLETLAATFIPLSTTSFREIFSSKIGYIVEWCRKSPLFYAHFAFYLLSQSSQTSNFGHILLSFLVDRLEKLGDKNDESLIYMRLLKLCFNSVNMAGTDNEHIMKLHLRRIVQGSMQYCLEAKEPVAYLTLLRTLFRSIGGGAHDKLYREFFPLLPEMLTTLNRLLRSAHRSYARDLLGELCVIVPVRLSTLLPYLSLLMEPLIYVLNCNTVNQGLRTLELCVDNMQPDFLYEHLYQVRGDMLLALYTSLHSQSEYVQKMAFKVLGKLGRYNRADLIDVQRLNLDVNEGEAGPLLRFWLKEFPQYPVDLPVRSLVDTAIEMVQDLTLDQPSILRAWQFLQGLCIAALNLQSCNEAENECSGIGFLPDLPLFPLQKLSDTIRNLDKVIVETYIRHDIHREVIMRVLGGVFLACAVQPLLTENGVFLTFLIRHLTLVNLSSLFTENQQEINSEPMKLSTYDQICPSTTTAFQSVDQVDTRLLIDAICFIMGHEDKELVPAGCLLLDEMLFTLTATIEAALALSSDPPMSIPMDIVIRLPLLQHLANATTEMLYHPAWYVKWGGCSILMHLQDRLPVVWFRKNLLVFLRGLLHCLHNLSDQMGQGALSLTRRCATNLVRYVFEAELNSKSTVRTTEETKAEGQLASHATTLVREPSKRAAGRRKAGGHKMTAGKGGRYKGTKDSSVDSTTAMNDSDAVMMETEDCWTGNANETHVASNYLVNMVLPELMEALLSETKAVRVESRHLLHLIASCLKTQLSGLLKPHLHVIESWLPPKSRINRLANLPIATQIAVIETNYFFCQPTTKPTEEGKNNDNTDLGSSAGVGILQYFPSRRCDYRFIIDLRAVLDTPLPSPGAQSPSTLAGGRIIAGTSSSPSVNAQQTPILSFLQLQQAIDLKVAACQVLSTTHYIEAQKSATLAALFKGICSESSSVHQPAFECIRNFVRHTTIDVELRHTFVKPILQNLRQAVNMRLATVRQLAYCAELFPSTFNERFCDAIYSHLTALVDGITNRPDTLSKLSSSGQAVELATALIDLFHLIPLAADKYVSLLIDLTVRMEQLCYIETTSPLRLPVLRFLAHHPEETVKQFLLSSTSDRPTDAHANRLFLFLLTCPESTPLVNYLMSHSSILADLLRPTKDTNDAGENIFKETSFRLPRIKGPLTRASPTHLALRVVHVLHKKHPDWLISGLLKDIYADASAAKDNPPIDLVSALLAYWDSPTFVRRHACLTLIQLQQLQPDIDLEVLLEESESGRRIGPHTCTNAEIANEVLGGTRIVSGLTDQTHWDEPTLMLDCLLSCAKHLPNDFNLLFSIVVGMARLRCVGFNPLRRYVTQIAQTSPVEWHRTLFLRFVALVRKRTSESKQQLGGGSSKRRKVHQQPTTLGGQITSPLSISQYLGTPEAQFKLLAHLILPCLQHALKKAPHQLLSQGKPPKPFEANDEDLVHLYVSVLLNDEAVNSCTGLRIMYYQLASLFIYYAPEFIHDVTSKVQSNRLRGITAFAWPCVTSSLNVVDLQEKYMGLQVLAHLIASGFQIAARTKVATLQVFHCLAKGTHTEVKKIVNPALDLLLPAWVTGPEEQKALAFGTRKIMMEDHGIQSCVHMLSLIVRHADLYYPIRHHILQLIIVITSRLSAQQLPIDQRRLILDMIETTVRWDQKNKAQQNQEAQQQTAMGSVVNEVVVTPETSLSVTKPTSMTVTDLSNSPMEKSNRDQLTNLMIRFACQSIDTAQNGASSEVSARKALNQIETTLASDVWGGELCELRLGFLDRFLCPDETVSGSTSANSSGNQTLVSGSQTSATTPGSTSTAASTSNNNLGPVQSSGVFMTLEVLRVIYSSLDSPTLLVNVKHFSKSVSSLLTRHPTNVRLVRACASLSRTLLNKFPADAAVRQKITNVPELFELYSVVLKSIQESFALFGDGGNKTALLPRLQSAFLLLNATQQATSNPYAFIDRCMSQLVKLLHRLIHDVTNTSASSSPQDNAASNQLTELLINGLEIVKSRLNVLSNETRKNAFGPDLFYIIDRSKNAKLFRTVARILKEWIIQAPSPKGDEKDHSASPPPITTREKVAFFVHLWQAFPRWADQPDVVREILDCIYQVFSSSSLRTHDIYSKLEEAFCCSLLTQLPEVREKFLNLYLMGSNLISQPMFPEEKEDDKNLEDLTAQDKEEVKGQVKIKTDEDSTTVPMATDDAGDGEDKKSSNSSLLVRLLFLFVSSSWDEAHFKDNFWLPLFFDVLLCDSDFTRPAYIAQAAAKFQSPAIWIKDKIVKTSPTRPVTMDIFDTSDLLSSPVPTAHSKLKKKESIFDRLQAQQIAAFTSLKSITFRETLRGLLNIVHRRPAIATELFGQLWYCLWQRILLKKSDRCLQAPTASVTVSDHISQLSDSFADTSLLSAAAEMIGSDSISLSSPTSTTVLPVDRELSSMSPGELRGFLMPQLIRFLTSDDHVNPLEAKPSPLGSLVAGLATTTDSLLLSVPLPVLSYIGYTHNQWYSMTLFFESLCARGLRALQYNRRNSSVDNDLTYSLCPEIDGSGAASSLPEDVPLGTAALSLIALYDCMSDPDHFLSAWWYRLNSNCCSGAQRLPAYSMAPFKQFSPAASQGNDRSQSDLLAALISFSQGQLTTGLNTALSLLMPSLSSSSSSGNGFGTVSPLWVSRLGAGDSSSNAQTPSEATGLTQFSEQINKARLHEYCIKTLKILGQWESLESLSAASQTSGNLSGASTTSNVGGGSPFWGIRADAAWRHNDWSDVFSALSGLANECPRHEQWRFALIQAAACIAGSRNGDFDSFSSSSGIQSSSIETTASGSGSTAGGGASGGIGSASGGASSQVTNLLQISESESHRVMSCILREWGRLPLIINNQHVALLQACQRATEINEGNILFIQHHGHSLSGSSGSASGASVGGPSGSSAAGSRIPLTQPMYDYKTVFRSWQGRPPLISDDLYFWNDLLSWRQIVHKNIITWVFAHKFRQEQTTLLEMCQRERALSQVQMARGYRKNGLSYLAQQQLDNCSRLNSSSLFERTKQEIKLKMADLRKEELLEGLELMEKTNIQQFEKKDKARFFCYKAVFFSHFNKGDEATKNFGYATQMQDNLHKVWSVYGDFLENVYSSYPAAKREIAVSTTGIFAMQALMEAATVAGTSQHLSHSDLGKCIWLLTLDDAGDVPNSPANTNQQQQQPTTPQNSSIPSISTGGCSSSQQRLARTFEERASRVHPDAFLPWLPSLAVCLLRPEGQFVASALRGIMLNYPTALSSILRGLQYQLTSEVERDRRIAGALAELPPDRRRRLDEVYGSGDASGQRLGTHFCVGDDDNDVETGYELLSRRGYLKVSGSSRGQSSNQSITSSSISSGCGTGALAAKRTKKRVVVVMRGAEGERLGGCSSSVNPELEPKLDQQASAGGSSDLQDIEIDDEESEGLDAEYGGDFDDAIDLRGPRTGYLSPSVVEGLHRVNLLFAQLRQRHPGRLFIFERFVEQTGGRLLPSWSEHLLTNLSSCLSQLHAIAWAHVSRSVMTSKSLPGLRKLRTIPLPWWLTEELIDVAACCGLPKVNSGSQEREGSSSGEDRASCDAIHTAYTTLANEANSDVYFKLIREKLMTEMANVGKKTVVEVINLLTNDLIPLIERRIDLLPQSSFVTERGAGRLLELISASSNQAVYGPFLRASPGGPLQTSPPVCPIPLLELPGETIRVKCVPALMHLAASSSQSDQLHQQPHLYLVDILPRVGRVTASANFDACPARRIALRASNGRLFFYDLSCLPRELPAGKAVAALQSDMIDADMATMTPTLAAYNSWRKASPLHLFQVINDVANRHPETAKRRLGLVVPRSMEIGPQGMRLVQVGASAPAASVVAANSVAFLGSANQSQGDGGARGSGSSLLAQQWHISPTNPASSSTPTQTSTRGSGPLVVGLQSASSFDNISPAAFPHSNAFASLAEHSVEAERQLMLVTVGLPPATSSSGYAGSRGVAAEVSGQPAGLEAGCYAAGLSLVRIVDSAVGGDDKLTSRQLIAAFYDKLLTVITTVDNEQSLKQTLVRIYEELLKCVPQGAHLETPMHSRLGLLSEELNGTGRDDGALRLWAFRRFTDAESYWLFRRGIALHAGILGLVEVLFNLTALRATSLLVEPRLARIEARNLIFDLPSTGGAIPKDNFSVKVNNALVKVFASTFAPLTCASSASAPVTTVSGQRQSGGVLASSPSPSFSLPTRSTPFRLTPQLTGLICPPGVPATIGPFAASMSTMGQAMSTRRSPLTACLRTLLRDDFVLWHRGRQAAIHASLLADLLAGQPEEGVDARPQTPVHVLELSNERLIHLIQLSTDAFGHRIKGLSERSPNNEYLIDLINSASSFENLACTDPSWLPWI